MLNSKKVINIDQCCGTIILIGVLAILLLGCQEEPSTEENYDKSTFVLIRDLADDEEFQDYLIDSGIELFYSNVITHRDTLFIASRGGHLISRSLDGTIHWHLKKPGNGPGEFDNPDDMKIQDDRIAILNNTRARVSLYRTDGQHLKDVNLQGAVKQFGIANNEIHTFNIADPNHLFTAYDIETNEIRRYGDRTFIPEISDTRITSENFIQFTTHLLCVDERYTVLGLSHYSLLLFYERDRHNGVLMDLSKEKEIVDSMEWHRASKKDFPPNSMITPHFLDLVKIGNYFGVTVPGPADIESALFYRISPDGQIHDKVYRPSSESRLSQMKNLTLLSDGTYFGQISSQDRLVIVSLVEGESAIN